MAVKDKVKPAYEANVWSSLNDFVQSNQGPGHFIKAVRLNKSRPSAQNKHTVGSLHRLAEKAN